MFQCPIPGLSHFYGEFIEKYITKGRKKFQCPIPGLSHFYQKGKNMGNEERTCFNALFRAYPISTMDRQKLIKEMGDKFQCPIPGLSHFY